VVQWVTKALESIGLLNKGSSKTSATPSPGEDAGTVGISTNSLNVTRVGGMTSLTVAVGTAALTLFQLNAGTAAEARAAAYLAVGFMVSAALIATAIILQSDVRARARLEISAQDQSARLNLSDTAFRAQWEEIVSNLEYSLILVMRSGPDAAFEALRVAKSTLEPSRTITPSAANATSNARLIALQTHIVSSFTYLASAAQTRQSTDQATEAVFPALGSMRSLAEDLLPRR
jgi:hypothetical protein